MKLSVIIPLYNKSEFIGRTLDSVLTQTFPEFEVIVVDDGSTDNSADIVKYYKDKRIKLIQQRNSGVSAARNTGIKNATGQWLAFLDADDRWYPDHLANAVTAIEKNRDVKWYCSAYEKLDQKEHVIWRVTVYDKSPQKFHVLNFFRYQAGCQLVCSSSVIIKKEVIKQTGEFIEGLNHGEDLDMWFRIALLQPRIIYCNQVTVTYQTAAESLTDSFSATPSEEPLLLNRLQRHKTMCRSHPEIPDIEIYFAYELRRLVSNSLKNTNEDVIKAINNEFYQYLMPREKILLCFRKLIPATLLIQLKRKIKKLSKRLKDNAPDNS